MTTTAWRQPGGRHVDVVAEQPRDEHHGQRRGRDREHRGDRQQADRVGTVTGGLAALARQDRRHRRDREQDERDLELGSQVEDRRDHPRRGSGSRCSSRGSIARAATAPAQVGDVLDRGLQRDAEHDERDADLERERNQLQAHGVSGKPHSNRKTGSWRARRACQRESPLGRRTSGSRRVGPRPSDGCFGHSGDAISVPHRSSRALSARALDSRARPWGPGQARARHHPASPGGTFHEAPLVSPGSPWLRLVPGRARLVRREHAAHLVVG